MKKNYELRIMNYGQNSSYGFSLIELLVVISIIMILSVIGMTNYKELIKKSRDTRRQSDMEQIRGALEMYRADEESYPPEDDLEYCGNGYSIVGTGADPIVYMNNIPCDPSTGNPYGYELDGTLKYTLGANFEIVPESNICDGLDCVSEACNYCIENP